MIQATAMGLASVYIMAVPTVMQSKDNLLEKLQITSGFIPIVMVSVGYAVSDNTNNKDNRLRSRILSNNK